MLAILGGFLALSAITGKPFAYFSKEPAETLGVPRYIGWAAHLTALVASFGAAAALFAGLLVRRQRGPGAHSGFLLATGVFTTVIVLDDVLQLHDWVFPALGVGERVVFLTYALMLVALVWRWGRPIVRDNLELALLAGVFLGFSVAMDQFADPRWAYYHLLEDGAKLLGLAMWTAYLVRTGLQLALLAPATALSEHASRESGGQSGVPLPIA